MHAFLSSISQTCLELGFLRLTVSKMANKMAGFWWKYFHVITSIHISMIKYNTILSTYTLYRHLELCSTQPSICKWKCFCRAFCTCSTALIQILSFIPVSALKSNQSHSLSKWLECIWQNHQSTSGMCRLKRFSIFIFSAYPTTILSPNSVGCKTNRIFSIANFSAWLFSEKTQGIDVALAMSSLSSSCKNSEILSYLYIYWTYVLQETYVLETQNPFSL